VNPPPRPRRTGGRWLLTAVLALFVIFVGAQVGCSGTVESPNTSGSATTDGPASTTGDAVFAQAFETRAQDLEVEGRGTVSQILSDDTEGDRHQRFVVRLASGQTLLVTHNIDVAPRVEGLAVGDTLEFKGVYEWNAQGGVIHWTHRDPAGSHEPGWIRHDGRTYQ
jgi:hypothetical protein